MLQRTRKSMLLCARTCSSTSFAMSRSYSSKVRAIPFAISKTQAIKIMSPYSSLLTYTSPLRDMIGRILPGTYPPFQPSRIQPFYFPAWFLDVALEATLWLKGRPQNKRTGTLDLSGSYLPGYPFEPLSRIALNAPGLHKLDLSEESIPTRLSSGDEIAILPHTISPIALLDIARSLPQEDAIIDASDMCFDPSTLKPSMLAAYPILIPVYLAQYDLSEPLASEYPGMKLHTILEAHAPDGRLSAFPLYPTHLPEFVPRAECVSFRDYDDRTFAEKNTESKLTFGGKVVSWLDKLIQEPGAPELLAEKTVSIQSRVKDQAAPDDTISMTLVDMDQPWIRPHTIEEVMTNRLCALGQRGMQRVTPGANISTPKWYQEWEASQTWSQT
ncbi:hypothetical protein HGRIS_003890 [Hohenbuehelia grisea]|uniref:Uncharacterized protein n=1 Tax=Hohenbuehelia grisea TaxID=104357 RepID=A0ABR3JHQ6_9AGAR